MKKYLTFSNVATVLVIVGCFIAKARHVKPYWIWALGILVVSIIVSTLVETVTKNGKKKKRNESNTGD